MLGAVAVGMAACSDDEQAVAVNGDGAAAVVTANIAGTVQSRAAGTQWGAGDRIGITGRTGSVNYMNVPYVTAAGNGSFTAAEGVEKGIFFQDGKQATFSAYYPYSDAVGEDNTTIAANTVDQHDSAAFDFLFADGATGSVANTALSFTGDASFRHRMSQVVIKLTADAASGFDADEVLANAVTTLNGTKADGEFDVLTGTAAATGEVASWTLNDNVELSGNAYTMIMFPQKASDVELSIDYEGANYACRFDLNIESGKRYTYNVTLRKAGLTVAEAEIADWEDAGSSDLDADMQPEPEPLVKKVLMREATSSQPALYFADRNIGASSPQDVGKYFWWGDIVGNTADEVDDGSDILDPSVISVDGYLKPEYDAATQILGEGWHMPTLSDMLWLRNSCEKIEVRADDVAGTPGGMILRNPDIEGAEIFLPFGRSYLYSDKSLSTRKELGYYWTNKYTEGSPWYVNYNTLGIGESQTSDPIGMCIRAVAYE